MKKSVTYRFGEDTLEYLDFMVKASGKNATEFLEGLIVDKYSRSFLPVTELYRSFEGRLDVQCRSGYIVTAMTNGRLKLECLSVDTDVADSVYIFKESSLYNRETEWSKDVIYDLISDIMDGKISVVR